ncbi:manganese-dependent inorganic pyrophosphatase [Nitrosomonas sp. ANs5]|uniref:manganese-dependent inorganic pyrophosphatase n=1 Tax=Nitrosomonas sp. ANs5 TaxID=3423941 RepID=UPI003D32678C
MLKVFGHLSPDTDTVSSAIVWAWYLQEIRGQEASPFILGELNSETRFVLERFDVSTPSFLPDLTEQDQVAIVDTNNPQELPENISDITIVEIIDHHKLIGGLTTKTPPRVTIRPLASTATIIYDLMDLPVNDLPHSIVGLMLSAILSDALAFRSPTTTSHDQEVARTLANALKVSIDDLADKLFKAKSDISGFSDKELIMMDSKKYAVGDTNIRVSVLETTTPDTVLARQTGIIEAITDCVENESDVDDVLFFIVDILKGEATVLTYNDRTKRIISTSFSVSTDANTVTLPGIVSRKKQILPILTG